MKAYKGFDKDLKCRGYQYEVGKEYEESTANCCHKGFHACENPLDVFSYYAPTNSRFCEVEQSGEIDKSGEDSKVASTKIKISAEIGLKSMIKAGLSFVMERVKATTGYYAHSATTGYSAHSATTGDSAHSATTGYYAHSATTGDSAHSATTGYSAHSATTGYYAHSATTGYYAHSATTGYYAHSAVKGKNSVAVAVGRESSAKACKGSAIVLAEYGEWNGKEYPLIGVKSAIVDGETLKADTYYTLKNGEFVEVKEDV